MRFHHVCLESIGYVLPGECLSSDEIESRLAPLYHRLRLPAGRLELMTGIRERRLWSPGTLPGTKSAESGQLALEAAGIDRRDIGALIHGSVCRDHLEPATASRVHHLLGLGRECVCYDVSNACLGLLNGMWQIANMIELGQIRAGLVVGTEDSRYLIENTIATLNATESLTRRSLKPAIASLTIGSGSCAMLLTHREISRSESHVLAIVGQAHTAHHGLCQSGEDEALAGGMQPWMDTDSEALLNAGVVAARDTFGQLLTATGWSRQDVDKIVTHQVGSAHQKLLLAELELPLRKDFATFAWLGNTGSVALPVTLALAAQRGHLAATDRTAILGIGSGINVVMSAVAWQETCVRGRDERACDTTHGGSRA